MPRDGLQQYHRPPGTDAVTNYTIESTKYNAYVADIEQDLNLPRPIVAGGTGATSGPAALAALGGEQTNQGPVTNYDTFPFVAGSFFSNPGATAAPPSGGTAADYFLGICYGIPGNSLQLECRALNTGIKYYRRMIGGVWQAWAQQPGSVADLDAAYVNVTGDTMTGILTMAGPGHPRLMFNALAGSFANVIDGMKAGKLRWEMAIGDGSLESGGNVGSDFTLVRYADDGVTPLGASLLLSRATGAWSVYGGVNVGGVDLNPAQPVKVSVCGPTTNSSVTAGQDANNRISMTWTYDATPTNAFGNLFTPSYARPIKIDASVLYLQSQSGAPVRIGSNTVNPALLYLDGNNASNGGGFICYSKAGTPNWYVGTQSTYSGNSQSHYDVYNATLGQAALSIDYSNNVIATGASIRVNGTINSLGNLFYFGASGAQYLNWSGTYFSFTGGPLYLQSGSATKAHMRTQAATTIVTADILKWHYGALKVAVYVDNGGNQGFSYGVASVTDAGIGYTDVTFATAFTNIYYVPNLTVLVGTTNAGCNVGLPSVGAIRCHSVVSSTGGLQDPVGYLLQIAGDVA